MTAERYLALCDNQPECYPEWLFFFGAVILGQSAVASGILALVAIGELAKHRKQSR